MAFDPCEPVIDVTEVAAPRPHTAAPHHVIGRVLRRHRFIAPRVKSLPRPIAEDCVKGAGRAVPRVAAVPRFIPAMAPAALAKVAAAATAGTVVGASAILIPPLLTPKKDTPGTPVVPTITPTTPGTIIGPTSNNNVVGGKTVLVPLDPTPPVNHPPNIAVDPGFPPGSPTTPAQTAPTVTTTGGGGVAVPEPSSVVLFIVAAIAVMMLRHMRILRRA